MRTASCLVASEEVKGGSLTSTGTYFSGSSGNMLSFDGAEIVMKDRDMAGIPRSRVPASVYTNVGGAWSN